MKKFILFFSIIILTGCYDYVEINNLSFISTIGIDYIDDKYVITYEILSDKKEGENASIKKASNITGSGKSISEAFDNITLKIVKIPYYQHIKAIIISEEIAKNHMKPIMDFLVRNPKIKKEFYLVVSTNKDAKDILSMQSDDIPVIGNKLEKMIDTGYYNYNSVYSKTFEDFLEKVLNPKIDSMTTAIEVKDDQINIKGISLFKDFNYILTLDDKSSSFLNILNGEKINTIITNYYDDKQISIKLFNGSVKYSFDNKINVTINLEGEILENTSSLDLKKEDTYKKLQNDFSIIINEELNNIFLILKQNNLDTVGLNDKQYKKSKIDNPNILKKDISIYINLVIDRKGLIFKVKNE